MVLLIGKACCTKLCPRFLYIDGPIGRLTPGSSMLNGCRDVTILTLSYSDVQCTYLPRLGTKVFSIGVNTCRCPSRISAAEKSRLSILLPIERFDVCTTPCKKSLLISDSRDVALSFHRFKIYLDGYIKSQQLLQI